MEKNAKINIVYFLGSFQFGGAEKLFLDTLTKIDRVKFNPFICVYNNDGTLKKEFDELQIPIITFPVKKKLIALKSLFQFIMFLKKQQIEVIHVSLVGCYLFTTIGGKLAGVRNIILSWSNVYPKNRTKKYLHVVIGSRLADRIIAISEAVKNVNIDIYKINQKKIEVVYCSIDSEKWNSSYIPNNNLRIIGCIGRLAEQKGYDILLNAFTLVLKEYPECKLEIIGTGPLTVELKNLSQELKISSSVSFLGPLLEEQKKDRSAKWSIFVSASRWEGFGIVLLEAMAMGKPIVSTRVDAIPEVVDEGNTGLLCKKENHEDLAEKIIFLLNDPDKARDMGNQGKERVKNLFELEMMVQRFERIYTN